MTVEELYFFVDVIQMKSNGMPFIHTCLLCNNKHFSHKNTRMKPGEPCI